MAATTRTPRPFCAPWPTSQRLTQAMIGSPKAMRVSTLLLLADSVHEENPEGGMPSGQGLVRCVPWRRRSLLRHERLPTRTAEILARLI